jgi:hypothetical protein
MKAEDLIYLVIYPALKSINLADLSAVALLAGTCSQETQLGHYFIQTYYKYGSPLESFGGGLGIFQMQRETHDDIVNGYLAKDKIMRANILAQHSNFDANKLVHNLQYAAIFTRIFYLQNPGALPLYTDISGLAAYYKKWYNTPLGKATEAEFIQNYQLVANIVEKFADDFK